MKNPLVDENNNALDKGTWETFNGRNPFNRKAFTMDQLKENTELKTQIDEYIKSNKETWEKAFE